MSMEYALARWAGDTVAVPELVFASLERADENCARVALYVLKTGCTDPRVIAKDLGLKSIPAASRALQWWAGAGLLQKAEPEALPGPAAPSAPLDLAAALRDPGVKMLVQHAQQCFGSSLGDHAARKVVELYLADGHSVEVILLCLTHLAAEGRASLGALRAELRKWRAAGVETGEDADAYLLLEDVRRERQKRVAALYDLAETELRPSEQKAIQRWYETWGFDDEAVEEAFRFIAGEKTVWAGNEVLKGWHRKGYRSLREVRGQNLGGSNARVDRPAAQSEAGTRRPVRRPTRLTRED